MSKELELKPCPFCGAAGMVDSVADGCISDRTVAGLRALANEIRQVAILSAAAEPGEIAKRQRS